MPSSARHNIQHDERLDLQSLALEDLAEEFIRLNNGQRALVDKGISPACLDSLIVLRSKIMKQWALCTRIHVLRASRTCLKMAIKQQH